MKREIYQAIAAPIRTTILTLLIVGEMPPNTIAGILAAGRLYQNTYKYWPNVAQLLRNTLP